jgi:hypothetical protein
MWATFRKQFINTAATPSLEIRSRKKRDYFGCPRANTVLASIDEGWLKLRLSQVFPLGNRFRTVFFPRVSYFLAHCHALVTRNYQNRNQDQPTARLSCSENILSGKNYGF